MYRIIGIFRIIAEDRLSNKYFGSIFENENRIANSPYLSDQIS